jgi:hypothetical protein
MNIRKHVIRTALILFALTQSAQAYELLCSNNPQVSNDQFRTTAQFSNTDFTIDELIHLFATGIQNARQIPTLVCLLPESHPATKRLFSDIGIDPFAVKVGLTNSSGAVRHVKLVQSESEMLACVESTFPSIGYVERKPAVSLKLSCFD